MTVRVIENATQTGRARQGEVGSANRFPVGGRRAAWESRNSIDLAYLNVQEIEDGNRHPRGVACEAWRSWWPFPTRPPEGRHSHALRIGPADAQAGSAVVITGGIHAREWVPPDALVNLAADLLEAYSGGTGLRYGGQRFAAEDIRSLVEGLQIVLFPCVNPDGRHHSQTAEPMWRKNRRQVRPDLDPRCVGVDLNRNFDALWDFRRHFALGFRGQRVGRPLPSTSLCGTGRCFRGRDAERRVAV